MSGSEPRQNTRLLADTDLLRAAFATVLREQRKLKGLTQAELAERADITMRYISLMETGHRQPTITTLFALAQAMDFSLAKFTALIEAQM